MMSDHGKSDNSALPKKSSNKVRQRATGRMEGRELAKKNTLEQTTPRTQGRRGVPSGLERIREAAQKDRKQRFTALLHHAYAVDRLRESYFRLKREAIPGIDGETWRHYGEKLEERPRSLRATKARGVSGKTRSEGLHPEGG